MTSSYSCTIWTYIEGCEVKRIHHNLSSVFCTEYTLLCPNTITFLWTSQDVMASPSKHCRSYLHTTLPSTRQDNTWQTPAVLPIPLSMEPVDPNSSPKQTQHTELHACCTIRPASPAEQSKQTDRQTTLVEAVKSPRRNSFRRQQR
jgi:hypothetical protein